MPVTKRTSKIVSYNEQDDNDDDFIPIVNKKHINKSNDSPIETKSSKQPTLKHEKKSIDLSKSEQEKSKEIIIENSDNQSSESVSDGKTSDVDDQDENFLPKNKRLKYDEEDDIDKNEEEEEEEEESIKKSIQISNLSRRHSSIPLGFPTSKINIPSPHVPRVGLSRKSLPSKSLHPHIISRILPE